MSSGNLGSRRLRFDADQIVPPQPTSTTREAFVTKQMASEIDAKLSSTIKKTTDWLLQQQHADGHWCGELEGDTILESEYLLLLAFLTTRAKQKPQLKLLTIFYHNKCTKVAGPLIRVVR